MDGPGNPKRNQVDVLVCLCSRLISCVDNRRARKQSFVLESILSRWRSSFVLTSVVVVIILPSRLLTPATKEEEGRL